MKAGSLRAARRFLDQATWDGSDVFMPGEFTTIIVVEAVRHAFQRAKVKNVTFTALEAMERGML